MDTVTIKKIIYPDEFGYEKERVPKVLIQLAKLRRLYSKEIAAASEASNVPIQVIEAFILIENEALNASVINSFNAVGLMQLVPSAATDAIFLANKAGLITEKEKILLTKGIGIAKLNKILTMKGTGDIVVSAKDLQNPQTNIAIGAIWLQYLMNLYTDANGEVRLDKVVVIYNSGYYKKIKVSGQDVPVRNLFKQSMDSTAVAVIASKAGGKETRSYLKKLAAKNGTLSLV